MPDAELPPPLDTAEAPVPPAPKKKRHGCLWALLITFVLGVFLLIAGVLVVRGLIKSAVRNYTATQPVAIPVLETTKAEAKEISDRAKHFFEDLKAGKLVEPLILAADDLNRLIADSGTNHLAGKLFVNLEDGRIKGRMSFPLDQTHQAALKGRYLNADVVLRVSLAGGELGVWAEEIQANEKAIPALVMSNLKQRNLADQWMNNQEVYAALQLIESVTVTNGALVVTPKP